MVLDDREDQRISRNRIAEGLNRVLLLSDGLANVGLTDPNAPAFVLPLPEGWVEDQKPDGNSFIFRPPNSRPMSAFISARVTKIGDGPSWRRGHIRPGRRCSSECRPAAGTRTVLPWRRRR